MPKSMPNGWENYSSCGKRIEGTRMIAFKVPLSANKLIDEKLRFTPANLVEEIERQGERLGQVIDLTYTTKYYKREDLENEGVSYLKIYTEGHVIPSRDIQKSFFNAVDQFLLENKDNDSLLGVHCTHGVNRTGFLICKYMIEKMGMDPDKAIKAFNKGRGHDIERPGFLASLRGKEIPAEDRKRRFTDETSGYGRRGREDSWNRGGFVQRGQFSEEDEYKRAREDSWNRGGFGQRGHGGDEFNDQGGFGNRGGFSGRGFGNRGGFRGRRDFNAQGGFRDGGNRFGEYNNQDGYGFDGPPMRNNAENIGIPGNIPVGPDGVPDLSRVPPAVLQQLAGALQQFKQQLGGNQMGGQSGNNQGNNTPSLLGDGPDSGNSGSGVRRGNFSMQTGQNISPDTQSTWSEPPRRGNDQLSSDAGMGMGGSDFQTMGNSNFEDDQVNRFGNMGGSNFQNMRSDMGLLGGMKMGDNDSFQNMRPGANASGSLLNMGGSSTSQSFMNDGFSQKRGFNQNIGFGARKFQSSGNDSNFQNAGSNTGFGSSQSTGFGGANSFTNDVTESYSTAGFSGSSSFQSDMGTGGGNQRSGTGLRNMMNQTSSFANWLQQQQQQQEEEPKWRYKDDR